MPSTVTHEYYYRDVYKKTSRTFKNVYREDEYRKYSVFAQGHDALFFSKFWQIHKHGEKRDIIHNIGDNDFKEVVLEMIQLVQKRSLQNSKEMKLLIYGYVLHHLLDSYAHPYIFYISEKDDLHAEVESFFDQEMIRRKEWSDPHKFKVHTLINNLPEISKETVAVVDEAFKKIYGYDDFGKMYISALNNVHIFLRLFRFDPVGIKNIGYSIIDKTHITSQTFSWLSYKKNFKNYEHYLNEEKETWGNPADERIMSSSSFWELYEEAVDVGAKVVSGLEECFKKEASLDLFAESIPDRSAIHGLKCNQNLKFTNLK